MSSRSMNRCERLFVAALRHSEDAGGLRNGVDIWTRYGWTGDVAPLDENGEPVFGYNIQRRTLDPILRRLTTNTPGVTSLFGCGVRALVKQDGVVSGVDLGGGRTAWSRPR